MSYFPYIAAKCALFGWIKLDFTMTFRKWFSFGNFTNFMHKQYLEKRNNNSFLENYYFSIS